MMDQDVASLIRRSPDVNIIVDNGTQAERGVAIFSTPEVTLSKINLDQYVNIIPDLLNIDSGRLLVASLATEDFQAIIINVYAPNNSPDRRNFFSTIT